MPNGNVIQFIAILPIVPAAEKSSSLSGQFITVEFEFSISHALSYTPWTFKISAKFGQPLISPKKKMPSIGMVRMAAYFKSVLYFGSFCKFSGSTFVTIGLDFW